MKLLDNIRKRFGLPPLPPDITTPDPVLTTAPDTAGERALLEILRGRKSPDVSNRDLARQVLPLRNALHVHAETTSQCDWSVYSADGRKVADSKLLRFLRRPGGTLTGRQLVYNLTWNWRAFGELCLWIDTAGMARPLGLLSLDPEQLSIEKPESPRTVYDVSLWSYNFRGTAQLKIPQTEIVYASNSTCLWRGEGIINSARVSGETYYEGARFQRDRLKYDLIPTTLIAYPAGTTEEQREEFEKALAHQTQRGDHGERRFKPLGLPSGSKESNPFELKFIEPDPKKFALTELLNLQKDDIYEALQVPPVLSGRWGQVTQDSGPEQNEQFVHYSIRPMALLISDAIQHQLVDRYADAWIESGVRYAAKSLTHNQDETLRFAQDRFPKSRYYVVLDTDTLPTAAQTRRKQVAFAQDLVNVGVKPHYALNYVGLDIPQEQVVDPSDKQPQEVPVDPAAQTREVAQPGEPDAPDGENALEQQAPEADPAVVSKLGRLINDVRGDVLRYVSEHPDARRLPLSLVLKHTGTDEALRPVRDALAATLHGCDELLRQGADEGVRGLWNKLSKKPRLKEMALMLQHTGDEDEREDEDN